MIYIGDELSEKKINWHYVGFLVYMKEKLLGLNRKEKIEPRFKIERRFYRDLLINKILSKDIITFDIHKLLTLHESWFYKKHRLFFLMCLNKETIEIEPFKSHFDKELKSLPKEIKLETISKARKSIRLRCMKVFNYKHFSSISRKYKYHGNEWNAYNYLRDFVPKSCPYCNMTLLSSLEEIHDNDKLSYILRPSIDHFISKSQFPFFSVSISNLVPSCYDCNSHLKNDADFYSEVYLNPLTDSYVDDSGFDIIYNKKSSIEKLITDISNAKISIYDFKITFEIGSIKSSNSINLFRIGERYNLQKGNINRFAKKLPRVNDNSIRQYMDILDINCFEEALFEFLEMPRNESDIKHYPFSLLQWSLVKKLKLL
ncbi:hypothetical protein [Enterovibrio norvegicus]|uniref:hypothetical protein n=1 Tax=Enterovibrio norvegicus TaxID=188144 RepID=UPI000C857C50|nr:hypothetical protein [Enterovibrio norvegicus]PMI34458.1 hypothetical protein BCU47_06295 [Enterovibrio norvegicus]